MSTFGMTFLPLVLGLGPGNAMEIGPALPPGGMISAYQPDDVADVEEGDLEGDEGDGLDGLDEVDEAAAEPAEASEAQPAPVVEDPAVEEVVPEGTPRRFSEWGLMVAPGPSFMVGPNWSATGAIVRLGIIKQWWRGHFMISSGPSVSYWFAQDKVANDKIHLATFNGELMIGGGVAEKFAVYGHAVLGLGYLQAYDGATDTTIKFVGGKSAVGVGGKGYITPRISVGALADFNYLGGLAVDAMVTFTFNFGRKAKS